MEANSDMISVKGFIVSTWVLVNTTLLYKPFLCSSIWRRYWNKQELIANLQSSRKRLEDAIAGISVEQMVEPNAVGD